MNLILLSDLALELNYDRSHLSRFAKFNNIPVQKTFFGDSKRQRLVISLEDAERIKALRLQPRPETGFFYIVQVCPDLDPNRLKLGFTINPEQRLSTYHTISPTARIVEKFFCKATDERPAIEFITQTAARLGVEVFQFNDWRIALMKAESYF